ncbi:MAG TPA: XRE family transcriptional regulator [Anaeromyxobacter sp.]|nr:XRE family transcriptional regulator [Anaeromyxobacter sp.]
MQKDIGERIRRMREAQALSREEVSRLAGVSTERLAAFEEGREVPSIGVVIKLSRVLGSRMEGLILGREGGEVTSPSLTVHRGARPTGYEYGETEQGYTYRTLTRPGTPGHQMEPFLLTFDPAVTDARPIAHDGQEFVYVLEGEIELSYDDDRVTLRPGDCAYLESSHPHLFRGLGESPSRMLAVVSSG